MTVEAEQRKWQGPQAGIARTFAWLRLAMSLLVLLLVTRTVLRANEERAAALDAIAAEHAAQGVGELVIRSARERGQVAIAACSAHDAAQTAELEQVRADLNAARDQVSTDVRLLAKVGDGDALRKPLGGVERHGALMLDAREQADRARGTAGCDVAAARFIEAASLYHEALLSLHHELLAGPASLAPALGELARSRVLVLDAAEYAGQERAILGAALARARALPLEEQHELHRRRGVVVQSIARLESFLDSHTPRAELEEAVGRMRQVFITDLEATRGRAYACVEGSEPCPLTAQAWFELASVGIDTIASVSAIAAALAQRELDGVLLGATRALAGAAVAGTLAALLVFFASGFVRRRIIDRLQVLRDAALRVAAGELEHPVAVAGDDEIGAVAAAVEHMRATVNQQNQELRELIEQLTQAQSQLVHQERLASVGHLAGGVAHEINNPLAIILGNVAHLIDTLADPASATDFDRAEALEVLREVRAATDRTSAIVRDLRDFAAIGPTSTGHVDNLDDAVRGAVGALAEESQANLRLELALDAPVAVTGSRAAVGQVLGRLVANAREACSPGGSVTLRTRVEGEHAFITVQDDGRGIAPEHLGRVLEPFFTTKRIGSGTGLGLSVCLGIVRQLGGDLAIDSTLGKGTVVTVTLPRAQAPS